MTVRQKKEKKNSLMNDVEELLSEKTNKRSRTINNKKSTYVH